MLQGKKIILGVSGGIAAYKAAELTRLLVKAGAAVYVVMTRAATEFVQPLTFETLSNRPVCLEMFRLDTDSKIKHIHLAEGADAIIVAPATANIIGKIVSGIADDLLSTLLLTVTCPKLIAPAMNTDMFNNPVVQRNMAALPPLGFTVIQPGSGELACGVVGTGRMAEPGEIFEQILARLTPKDLAGETILVTAGPTREYLDPVRFISNPSSGKMGCQIAQVAKRRGARVILIHGPVAVPLPVVDETVAVETATEMKDAIIDRLDQVTVLIKAAAVGDFKLAKPYEQKIKKQLFDGKLELIPNVDILQAISARKGDRLYVGFAAETDHLEEHARQKLQAKKLDLIVANDIAQPGSGFAVDTNAITMIDRSGAVEICPCQSKEAVAGIILDKIQQLLNLAGKAGSR
jgi:phosphopantothenoylcysteine decarboxylase/phosphopantothenate--cysteine ligase